MRSQILAVLAFTSACAPETIDPLTTESGDAAVAAVEAVGLAGDAALLADGIAFGRMELGIAGFACDDTPEITMTTVCSREYPATAHLEWTSCPGTAGGSSFGVVDLTQTITADPPTCGPGTTLTRAQAADFDVTRTRPGGGGVHLDGNASTTAVHVADAPPTTRTGTFDVRRERLDETNAVVRTIDTDGSYTLTFDASSTPPTRTLDAELLAVLVGEETSLDITVVDLVRVPSTFCPYPISGSVTVVKTVAGASTTHVLVYGPDCGDATLDGQPFPLPQAHP